MSASRDTVLSYFRHELNYLRSEAVRFARQFPELAERLALSEHGSADPHVERLLEGVAFLTARVQRAIDDQLPSLARRFLEAQQPHYLLPVPPLALARFDWRQWGSAGVAVEIPRGLQLFRRLEDGTTVKFQTCYDTTVWPLIIEDAQLGTPAELGVSVEMPAELILALQLRVDGAELDELDWSRPLRVAFDGDPATRSHLLEMFVDGLVGVYGIGGAGELECLTGARALPVGFGREHQVLPYTSRSHAGYRLVHEYFAFPRKFEFVDLQLPLQGWSGDRVELLIGFARRPGAAIQVGRETLRLGVTPIINLFSQAAEPIIHDRKSVEYRVVPDNRWERSLEVHSILEVLEASPDGVLERLERFHSGHLAGEDDEGHSDHGWLAHRRPTSLASGVGDDVYLSIAEPFEHARRRGASTVHVRTLCSNRDVAARLVAGLELKHELDVPVIVTLLSSPTPRASFLEDADTVRRLVAHVAASRRALLDDASARRYLRDVLALYSEPGRAEVPPQIRAIRGVRTRLGARYLPELHANARGVEVDLELSEAEMYPLSTWAFEAVLSEFLHLTAPLGSYSRLRVHGEYRAEPREWSAKLEGLGR